jgi:hypothetical protein
MKSRDVDFPHTIDDALVDRIRFELHWRGWDLSDLLDRLKGSGIHFTSLQKILDPTPGQKRRKMTVSELCSFANALEMSLEELLSVSTDAAEGIRRARMLTIIEELSVLTRGQTREPFVALVPLTEEPAVTS